MYRLYKAIEAAKAVNIDNVALLEVIQDCFLLLEDDPVDDSEVESAGEWRVADDLEGTCTYSRILKHNHHNMLIICVHAETTSSERQQDTVTVLVKVLGSAREDGGQQKLTET